jgi:hypothetical protein
MPVEMEQAVTIAPDARWVDLPEKTGSQKSESYLGPATGEGILTDRVVVDRSQNLVSRPSEKGKSGHIKALPSSDHRRAFRRHWTEAQEAAGAILQAAESNDLMGVGISADKLDQSLGELWNLREGRDIDWQTILNHMQGMMRTFFLEKRAETLTADQCKRIVELVKDYLGPATKTIDDLNEVLRLIDDAGFDPYAAISADPIMVDDKD